MCVSKLSSILMFYVNSFCFVLLCFVFDSLLCSKAIFIVSFFSILLFCPKHCIYLFFVFHSNYCFRLDNIQIVGSLSFR